MQNINKFLYLALSIGIVASSSLYACDKYHNKYNVEEIYTGNNNINDDEISFGDDSLLLNNNIENNNNSLPKNIDKINDGKKTKVNENVNTLQEFITKSSTGTVHNPFIEVSNKKLNNPFIDLQNNKTSPNKYNNSPFKQKFNNNNISPNKFNSINNFNPNKNNINISNELKLRKQFANINNINKVKNTNNIIRVQNPYLNSTNTPTFLNNNNINNNAEETVSTVLEKMQRHINRESTKFNANKNNINEQLKRIKDYQDAATTMLNDWNKEIIEIAKKLGTTESSQNQNDIAIKNLVERMNHEKFDDDVENELIFEQVSNAKLLKNNRRISKNISENNNTNLYVKYSYDMGKISDLMKNSPNINMNDKKKIINTNNMLNVFCYKEFENIKDDLDKKLQNIRIKQNDIHYRIINLNRLMKDINNDTNNTLKTTADHNESVRYLQNNVKKILNANRINNTILLTPEFDINANYNDNTNNNIDLLPNINNIDNNSDTIELINNDVINGLYTNTSTKNVLIKLNKKLSHFNRVNNDFSETCNALNTWGNDIENNTNNNLTLLNNNKNKIINKLNNATEFNKKHSLSIKKIQISMCDAEHYKKIHETISYKFQDAKDKNMELSRKNMNLETSLNFFKGQCKRLRKANNTERNRDRSSDSNINNRERSRDREISEEKSNTNLANNNLRNISSNNEEMNIEETNNNQINIEINNNDHANNNDIEISGNTQVNANNTGTDNNHVNNNNIGISNNHQRSSFVRTEIPANSNRYTISYPKFGPKPEKVILDSEDEE